MLADLKDGFIVRGKESERAVKKLWSYEGQERLPAAGRLIRYGRIWFSLICDTIIIFLYWNRYIIEFVK